jgi:hypothetical protein
LLTFFQYQVSQRRIELDRVSAAAEGTMTVKVDRLPSDRRDCLEKDQGIASAGKSPKAGMTEFSGVWAYNPNLVQNLIADGHAIRCWKRTPKNVPNFHVGTTLTTDCRLLLATTDQ